MPVFAGANVADFVQLAQGTASGWPEFFLLKGPGRGDKDTAAFMIELRKRAALRFGPGFASTCAERQICGAGNDFAVDFYFSEEATIVEVALTLRNPSREFEKDVVKAVLAKRAGNNVRRLLFLAKPGAIRRNNEPGPRAITSWAIEDYGIAIETIEIKPPHPPPVFGESELAV